MTDSGGPPLRGFRRLDQSALFSCKRFSSSATNANLLSYSLSAPSPLILWREAEVALRNAWISSLNMATLILGVRESISETELWRSDDNGDSSVHGVDRRLEADRLMRGLLWSGTETAVVPLLRGARFLY
jgi:hypothetical protein